MTENIVLKIDNLVKKFTIKDGEVTALDGVSLNISKGEFISIVGPSGCGKSTMLRMITALEDITSGSILVDDKEIHGPSEKVSMIYQESRLFPWLTVEDNVKFVLDDKMPKDQKNKIAEKYIRLVGLWDFKKALPGQLSGGMQQRVSIARALVTEPEILLLDEPFGALDAFTRMNLQSELHRIWREQNNTMILVTHDIDEAIYLSDRVVIMSERPGKVKKIIPIKLGPTRYRGDYSFLEYRKKILEHFIQNDNVEIDYYL